MEYVSKYFSPIGELTIASNGSHITGLWIEDQRYFGANLSSDIICGDHITVVHDVKHWLDRYFSGEQPDIRQIPLAPKGTAFQKMVWDLLLQIPWACTCTYGELAKLAAQQLGRKTMSAQAIGNAVGKNPIAILIPCHRVIGADGSLTGYAGGIHKKKWLLDLEVSKKKC